ncbi:DUF4376 domain-containing protein [Pandoraea sp. XJJ-1]|uniref:DUF4376 domain-containing protein n=1 Tax=Pandoraea sp. XJJ-1 TaxID=3002643 RepID=UPI002282AC71|nr:DUF4376 domain-containing protein [Pandoraea sp. XJJ-1]WAL80944.1 DUF4376 domain-containing protein [Pandoraea sp. XJJ-1]
MPYFQDTSGRLHFLSEDDIANGGESFLPSGCTSITDAEAEAIENPPLTLSESRKLQDAMIDAAYVVAAQMDVSYSTAAGVTKTYQADCGGSTGLDSQSVLLKAVTGYDLAAAVPSGFTWKSADNTLVAFTLDDLKGLYAAMLEQGRVAFAKRAALKAEIAAATTIEGVQAITWG